MSEPIILLFDAECILCSRITRFLLKRDKRGVFRFAGLQSEPGQRLLREHGLHHAGPDSFVMIDGGRAYVESGAALRVLARLPGGWRLISLLLAVPPPLRDPVYRFVARRRYRWFGKADACMLPPPGWKDRFLD